jgi:hypothetical protein
MSETIPLWQLHVYAAVGALFLWGKLAKHGREIYGLTDILERMGLNERVRRALEPVLFVALGAFVALGLCSPPRYRRLSRRVSVGQVCFRNRDAQENTMKSWLRDDRVYQAIMNGALWIVVIAALSTTKWPQLSWFTGSITAVLVVIVATAYWIAVVSNDNDKPESTARRQSTQLATGEETQDGRNVAQEPSPQQQRGEIAEAYWNAFSKNREALRNKNDVLRSKTYEVLHRRLSQIYEDQERTIWTNFEALRCFMWVARVPAFRQ